MFNLLKDKLKSWLGKSEETKETPAKKEKKPKKTAKAPKIKKEKLQKKKKETNIKTEKIPKAPSDKQLKNISEKIKEEVPQKFETGLLQYQPDVEKITEEKPKGFFSKLFSKKEEQIKEETVKPPVEEKTSGFFSKFSSKFTTSKITKEQVEDIFQDLEIILLESNVALEVVDKIKENLIQELVGVEAKKEEVEQKIVQALKNAISSILIDPDNLIEEIKNHEGNYTIVFFGINGSGKTTSIAKLAHKLKKSGISVALAAADTFRAAAVEQLEVHANRLNIPIIKSEYGSDPTAVAFDAKQYAQKNNIKCLLIDTAGRMYTKENLIKQMEKLIRVIKPNKKIFVGESTTGNDAIEQAKTFNEAIGIDGIILSKADVDEKGGTSLSVSYVTKKPIYFLGTGQTYDDLEIFSKDKILKSLGLD